MKKNGTMDKTMVLWTKLWCYTENDGTSIYEGKKDDRLPKMRNCGLKWKKNYGNIQK